MFVDLAVRDMVVKGKTEEAQGCGVWRVDRENGDETASNG